MTWVRVGTKSVSVTISKPAVLPEVISWSVSPDKKTYAPGDTIVLSITISTGDGTDPLPLYWEVSAFGRTYTSSAVYQNPNTTRTYTTNIPIPTTISEGSYTIGVTLYKGTTPGEAPPGAV